VSPIRLTRIGLVCDDVETTARFYETAFGFAREGEEYAGSGASADAIGVASGSTRTVFLRLGEQSISLLDIEPHGRRYPDGICGANLLFQHFAIVVADMRSAYERLRAHGGWTAISTAGPERLPASSGGVTAFKFRDPEGHPLELLAFPENSDKAPRQRDAAKLFLGIDHSALSVADTSRSLSFYRMLGLTAGQRTFNVGVEQDRLDGMAAARVEVTALVPPGCPTPHVELLCYRSAVMAPPVAIDDVAATRLVLAFDDAEAVRALCRQMPTVLVGGLHQLEDRSARALLRDPDGHFVVLEAPAR
jgi:catechol 2,3-dioxygenase-like lactoylglutathione lyase family enzyme